uniref:Hapless 8 n=1 Tax=Fagus sylvatica TaxID=28930 RepID=A0A2N9J8X3_FAGSY
MLSIENPPPDPSCPCDIPHLKTSNDERASHKLALPEVDLSNTVLFGDTPLPKFSIRDYVFNARSKDIKTNWPFSSENLQLCLKHGVKDVLPPFQALDKVRNQSFKRCTVESCTLENKNLSNFDGEPSRPNDDDDAVLIDLSKNTTQLNQKTAEDCIETTSCRFEGENDFPSTTTSVSQSDDIESLPTNRPSSSSLDTDHTLPEASVEVEEAVGHLPPPHKTESTTRPSGKKCRLVVKFGANSDRSSTEDITSNCTTVSELSMASKICPVCKIFSSSSNTTLNAHIDQCLSVESVPKWMADSKLTRHRIKPRKTKLMVDIYTTAARCTLEELDRRNGTNWAAVSSLPSRDNDKSEMPAEGRKQRMFPVHEPDTGDVGAVYIDSNGTKVRILSKFNDAPSVSKVVEDLGPRKPSKGGKGTKFLSIKKKKRRANKHHKYLKLASQSKKHFSHRSHSTQIYAGQGVYHGEEERCERNEHQIQKQVKPNDSGNVRPWVRSKRTGVAKKIKRKVNCQPPIESDHFCFGDSLAERSQVSKPTNVSQNPISSLENSERMKNPFFEAQVSDKGERSPGRKRVGSSLFRARSSDSLESNLPPMKRNFNQLSKDSNSVCEGCMLKRPNSTGNCVCLLSSKLDNIAAGSNHNSDTPPDASTDSSRSFHSLTSKAMKFSSLRKNVLAVRSGSSVTESRLDVIKKHFALKNSQVHLMEEIDEELMAWYPEADEQYDLMHNEIENKSGREEISNKVSFGCSTVPKIKNDRALNISRREEAVALKSSQLAPLCHGYDEGENMDSSDRVRGDFLDKDDGSKFTRKQVWIHGQDVVIEPATREAVGETVTSLCKSVDPELQHKLGNCTETQSSIRSIEDYKGPLYGAEASTGPTEPSFIDGQEIYCNAEVGNGLIGQNVHIGEEMDSEIGQANFFVEVDPIPIPGPPGSFLPSPGDMGSEDLQGNSSLTTSRVQSSQDQHDFIDGDSSDSPISATSTISNPTVAEYDRKYFEPLSSVGTQLVQDKMRSGLSGASIEPSAESAAVVRRTNSAGVERLPFDGENCKVNKISIEKGPLSFKSDEPCCCQRKERTSQGIALNYQESQLLKRRAIPAMTMPTMGKQMGCNLNTRPGNSDVRSEIFSLNSCASSKSEKVAPPNVKSSAGPIPLKASPDVGVKFSGRGGCDSGCTSASNPVLRLMGKNLMVVNKDEDASMPLGQAQPHSQINHLTSRYPTFSDVSPVNIQNQVYHSYHPMVPQIGQDPHNLVGHCFDGRLSNSFRSHTMLKTPQTLARGPAGLFPDHCKDGGFVASMEPHEYKGHYSVQAQQNKSKNRPIGAPTYNMEKFITFPDSQQMINHSAANANKEIIIIDDIPDCEANSTTDVSKYSGGLRERQVVSSGISIPVVPNYNSRHANPFSYYQSQDPSLLGELPVMQNTTSLAISSRGANASPARWSCTSEGSGVLQRSPFFVASPSTGHLRSALYNSPSLS